MSGTVSGGAPEPPGYLGFAYTVQTETAPKTRQWLHVRLIAPGSPAQTAGLQPQDIIVAINGMPVQFKNKRAAVDFFSTIRPQTVVRFAVVRGGKERAVAVRAAKMSPAEEARWRKNYEVARQMDDKQQ